MTQAGYSSSSPAPSKVVSLAAAVIVGGLLIAAAVVAMAVLTTLARALQALAVALSVIGGVAVLAVAGAVAHRQRRGAAVIPDGKCPPRGGHRLPPGSAVRIEPSRENGCHALRHHFASVLLFGGVDPKALSDYLGHHSAAFTLAVHTHLLPSAHDRMRQVIDAVREQDHGSATAHGSAR